VAAGKHADVFTSSNVDNGDAVNERIIEKYASRVSFL